MGYFSADGERQILSQRLAGLQASYQQAMSYGDQVRAERWAEEINSTREQMGMTPREDEPEWLRKARSPHFLPSDHTQERYQQRLVLVQRLAEQEAALKQAVMASDNEHAKRYLHQVHSLQAQLETFLSNQWGHLWNLSPR